MENEAKTLLQLGHFRVHTISRIEPSEFDPGKKLRITDKSFTDMPVGYGLAIEAKTANKSEDGGSLYYVVAFVHWDAKHNDVEYDALLDRIADEWANSPEFGAEFREALAFAEAEVAKANRDQL